VSHLVYLAVLAVCLLATAPLELLLRTRVYRRWRRLLLTLLPVVVIYSTWDVWAVSKKQWSYDRGRIVGVLLPGNVPLEELLFFIVIPICAVLTLEAVRCVRPSWIIGDEAEPG
jgi:lycopene cyclase domain-containing protein